MKQLKLVFVCEQIKAQQVIPDKVKRAFVESFCNHSPSLPLNIKQFSSESLWKHSYIWRYFAKVWTLGLQSLLPDGLQVPVNGDVDRKAGGLEEVRPQVPLHDPCLGETHLFVGGGERQIVAWWRVQHLSSNKNAILLSLSHRAFLSKGISILHCRCSLQNWEVRVK